MKSSILIGNSHCSALSNQLILENLFRFLDFRSLQTARLVCTSWEGEALKRIGELGVIIHLQPPFENTKALRNLISRHRIRPTLVLSFQTNSWICNLEEYNISVELHEKINASVYSREPADPSVLQVITAMGAWVTELRLELPLMYQEDAGLVVNLLRKLKSLTKFCLNILSVREEGLLAFPTTGVNLFPTSLVTLGLNVRGQCVDCRPVGHDITLDAVIHFMRAVSASNIQFLDLDGWQLKHSYPQDLLVKELWLEAISYLMTEDDTLSFPKLSGLKEEIRVELEGMPNLTYPFLDLYLSFPRSLSNLCLTCFYPDGSEGRDALDKLHQVIQRHALTLRSLDLESFGTQNYYEDQDEQQQQHDIQIKLSYLPLLTSLNLTISFSVAGGDLKMVDLLTLNLRDIFLGGPQALNRILPSLTTLSVLFSWVFFSDQVNYFSTKSQFWDYIFPDKDPKGKQLEFHQLKVLNVGIIVDENEGDDCRSHPQLSRFFSIFPSLQTLRHAKKRKHNDGADSSLFFACKHDCPNNGTWSTFTKTWSGYPELRGEDELHLVYCRNRLRHLLTSHESDPWFWY